MADVRVVLPWSIWPMVPTEIRVEITVDVRFLSFELGKSLGDPVGEEGPGLDEVFQHTFSITTKLFINTQTQLKQLNFTISNLSS